MNQPAPSLRINVGFIVHQTVGYQRDFTLAFPALSIPPDLALKDFDANIRINRATHGLLTQVNCQATIHLECVRCLTDIMHPLATSFTEFFAFSRNSTTDSDLILPDNHQIDFTPLIREYLILEIPIGPLCKIDCKGLCPICGENKNENLCQHETDDIDPRLLKLKSFLDE